MLTLQIATLRATMIIKRAVRIGGDLFRTERNRAVRLLVEAGMQFKKAVRFACATCQISAI